MQLYTGYFSSDYSLCVSFSLPMCQERSDDDDDDDDDDDNDKSLHFCVCFLNVKILYIRDAVQQSGPNSESQLYQSRITCSLYSALPGLVYQSNY